MKVPPNEADMPDRRRGTRPQQEHPQSRSHRNPVASVFLEVLWEIVVLLCLFSLRYVMKDAHRPYTVPLPLAVIRFLVVVALVVLPLLKPVDYVLYLTIAAMFVAGALYYVVFVVFTLSVPGSAPLTRFLQKVLFSAHARMIWRSCLKKRSPRRPVAAAGGSDSNIGHVWSHACLVSAANSRQTDVLFFSFSGGYIGGATEG
ncbi:hypothetical protein V5799_033649 [Amblyomma americanum]|uniref:Uncharacterized protein n=1 Tax=Amblyomma americanum TaxID=6943 RepID=A0AAQ4DMQ5_AMBAM